MIAIFIMLIVLLEVILSGFLIFFFIKSRKNVLEINKEVTSIKKEITTVIADYRISLRNLNQEIKSIQVEQKTKQLFDFLSLLTGASLFFEVRKKKLS